MYDASLMYLVAALATLGLLVFTWRLRRQRLRPRPIDVGAVSDVWLAEYRRARRAEQSTL